MAYDLVIRGGTVVDGSGKPGYRADVAVHEGRIAEIGAIGEAGRETIDAGGNTAFTAGARPVTSDGRCPGKVVSSLRDLIAASTAPQLS